MPALPVAQMPGARQTGMARMALLAVELAQQADARLVLRKSALFTSKCLFTQCEHNEKCEQTVVTTRVLMHW